MNEPALPKSSVTARVGILGAILAACALIAPLTLKSEGVVHHGYRDPVGIVTECAGHTHGASLAHRDIPDAVCQRELQEDLVDHGQAIAPCITREIPLKVRAAFTDFAFNAGAANFCRSTMAAKANAGDLAGACAELSRWVYAGGKVLPGLVTRRAAERNLCEAGAAEAAPAAVPHP